MNKITKWFLSAAMFAFLVVPALSLSVNQVSAAVDADTDFGLTTVEEGLGGKLGTTEDPKVLITKFINLALTFLGLIAVVIILIGGFKWMTSGGNEEKTTAARKLLVAGVVGLVIVLASWGLASWLVGTISTTTSVA